MIGVFFVPVFSPLARGGGVHEVCSLSMKDCPHGDSCPMKHKIEPKKKECHTHKSNEQKHAGICTPVLICSDSDSAMNAQDMHFLLARVSLGEYGLAERILPFIEEKPFHTDPQSLDKPPDLVRLS